MVLRRRQRPGPLPVGQRKNRELFPLEEVLHEHLLAGVAEPPREHGRHGGPRLLSGGAHHGSFSCGQSRGFHHQRFIVGGDVVQRRALVRERLGPSGRHACSGHHVLGEGLGRLDLGGCLGGTEGVMPGGREGVHHTGGQGRLRSDHREIDVLPPNGVQQGGMIVGVQGQVGGAVPGARVPRGTKNGGGRGQCPTEGMLPAATADDE